MNLQTQETEAPINIFTMRFPLEFHSNNSHIRLAPGLQTAWQFAQLNMDGWNLCPITGTDLDTKEVPDFSSE